MLGRRYQLGKELGRGASGAVYHGQDVHAGRSIAVKVLSAGATQAPGHVVMKYAQGRDLRAHTQPRDLAPARDLRARFGSAQTIRAVAAAVLSPPVLPGQ